MPSTARQLRQPPTIEAIGRVPYFADAVIGSLDFGNLIIKFYNITSYSLSGTLTGYSPPYGLYLVSLFL